ncbi:MAG: hypothetical protein AAF629_29705, partial [Chloroflexota bacterium]
MRFTIAVCIIPFVISACTNFELPNFDQTDTPPASLQFDHTSVLSETDVSEIATLMANDIDKTDYPEVYKLLPTGTTLVDIMELATPPRLEELFVKFQTSIQQDREWWTNYVQQATPGQPLPYHEKMGLREDEYFEVLSLQNQT